MDLKEKKRQEADNILTALARRCNKRVWDVLWCTESKSFNLLFLDKEDQEICTFQLVQHIETSSSCYPWVFGLTKRGKRISSYKAAFRINRGVLARATLNCMLAETSRGHSLAYFTNSSSQKPKIFLEAGTTFEKLVMSLLLEGLL